MPLKIIRENQAQLVGRGRVLLSVPPLTGQSRELYVGSIGEEAALLSKAHAMISREPKGNSDTQDLSQTMSEFQTDFKRILEDSDVQWVLQIAGTNDSGIEIRIDSNTPGMEEIVGLTRDRFSRSFEVKVTSSNQTATNRGKTPTISIMLGPEARGFQKDSTITIISDLVDQINGKLGKSESDEGVSDVLD